MNDRIYEELKRVARNREYTTYQKVGDLINLDMENPAHRNELAETLDEIPTFEHSHQRPMLSVVVVRSDKNIPGEGFFKLARQLGRYDGRDDLKFFVEELQRAWDQWAKLG